MRQSDIGEKIMKLTWW